MAERKNNRSEAAAGKRASNAGQGRSRAAAGRSNSAKHPADNRKSVQQDNSIRDEIIIIISLLFSVLLVLSYLGLAGSCGDILNKAVFGVFGKLGYVFPFLLFFIIVFCISNKKNRSIVSKAVFCIILLMLLSALIQVSLADFRKDATLADFFNNSLPAYSGKKPEYGGVIGGVIVKLMYPFAGRIATVCILVALILVFFVLIAGKAIFTSITKSSAEHFAEYRQRRLEEKQEFDEQLQATEEEYYYDRRERKRYKLSNVRDSVPVPDYSEEELLGSLNTKKQKDKSGFIDGLMRRGMGLDVVEDTPEFKKMISAYEKSEETKEFGERQDSSSEELPDDGETDIVESELKKKFAGSGKIEVPVYMNAGSTAGKRLTRTYMVDEEEELEKELSDSVSMLFEEDGDETPGEPYKDTDKGVPSYPADNGAVDTENTAPADEGDNSEKQIIVSQNDINRTSSGAACFSDMSKLKETEPRILPYTFPPISLLNKGKAGGSPASRNGELKATVEKLQSTFESFGVGVTVTDATCGPTVTRYEILPDQGVKVKTITSLVDDIKLALAAAEIRIEAPIPGKAAVGIEVPNRETTPVIFRDLIDTPEFKDAHSKLTFAVGKDIGGKTICFDIASMPHMLIAGATGSGKSVCINSLIMSILYKAKPSEVRMIMIDPKRVELIGYNGIPHLLVPVVTDVKKASGALNWAIAEMDDRYEKFASTGVNNLASYNSLVEEKYYEEGNEGECPDKLPQILIIVDELNDLMMTANSKEVEAAICRLTQLARASGIHVVLATQRPSVNVITGTIKANIPSRVAFAVSSIVDSRTILDQAGAEKLLGKGDMLFYPQGYPKPVRLQGAFVSDREVASVVDFIKSKCKEVKYSEKISRHIDENSAGAQTAQTDKKEVLPDNDGRDEFFADAGRMIIEKQKASIGLLQRVFKIGFNRAARIMDQLAEEGVVGPEEGTKPRRILMNKTQYEEFISGAGESTVQEEDGADSESPDENI